MKVVQISNYFAEFKGSFINQLELLGNKILENGGEIIYIFPNRAQDIEWCKELRKKFKVYFVSFVEGNNEQKVIAELREIFDIERPNIVHSHFDGYDVPITKATSKDVIKIYHRHNEFDVSNLIWYKKIYALMNIKKRMFYIKKGYQIFISENMKENLLEKRLATKERSFVILNGISTKRIKKKQVALREENRIPIIFAFVGNWHSKGGDVILKALETINRNKINVYLACISSPEFIEAKYGYNPKWIINLKKTENIKEYYLMADIFVSASRNETFSYALGEAIYCGLPCISSDIDGVQWAKEIDTVTFFESENINDLISKIKYNLVNNYNLESYEIAQNIITNKYSEYRWCEKIISLYNYVLSNIHLHKSKF